MLLRRKTLWFVAFGVFFYICCSLYNENASVSSISKFHSPNFNVSEWKTYEENYFNSSRPKDEVTALRSRQHEVNNLLRGKSEPNRSKMQLRQLYVRELEKITYHCGSILNWGGNSSKFPSIPGYGAKKLCLDEQVRPDKRRCLIYSFGINEEWSFDVAARDYGCEVFAFDPSMKRQTSEYSRNIHFYKIGLSDKVESVSVSRGQWELMGFMDIVKMLGHENRTVDIVKMDVERAEWSAISQMIRDGSMNKVKQLLVETHFQVQPFCHAILKDMYQYGLRIFLTRRSGCYIEELRPCFEVSWINKKFL